MHVNLFNLDIVFINNKKPMIFPSSEHRTEVVT